MCTLHVKKHAHGAISYITNIFNLSISTGQIPDIWHEVIIIPFPKPGKNCKFDKNWRPFSLQYPAANELENLIQPKKYLHTTSSTRLNIAFGRETRQALQCRRSPPTLLPAYQEKRRLSIRYSSRSIWKLHSTMWTMNSCLIVSSTPTYRHKSASGSTSICRTDETKYIIGNVNMKEKRWKHECSKEVFCLQRN